MHPLIRSICHPTDFSEHGLDTFLHALRIALLAESRLDIVHVASAGDEDDDAVEPHVRHALHLWGLMDEAEPPNAVAERFKIKVAKIVLAPQDAVSGVLSFLARHPSELIVLATHGRDGLNRLLLGSVAESLAQEARALTLFIPSRSRGFVDRSTGSISVNRVLVPVDHHPAPGAALQNILQFAGLLNGHGLEIRFLHVGKNPPALPAAEGMPESPVVTRSGNAVEVILQEARDWNADLVVMPTAGHYGLFDAVRGSTSERVLRHAPCPVLAVPIARS